MGYLLQLITCSSFSTPLFRYVSIYTECYMSRKEFYFTYTCSKLVQYSEMAPH